MSRLAVLSVAVVLSALLPGASIAHAQDASPTAAPPAGDAPVAAVTGLDQALLIAFSRSPSIQLQQQRIIKTARTIDQLTSGRGPSIGLSATYSRLSGAGAFAISGGATPAQLQNPFGVGLTYTPPGVQTVQLSGGTATGGSAGASGATATGTASSAAGAAATSRAAEAPAATSRQTNGNTGNTGNTGGNNFGTILNQEAVRLSVVQFIDLTGLLRAAIRLGDTEKAIQALELVRTRQDLGLTVRSGFYSVLRAEALVAVAQAAVTQSQEQVRVTEAQLRAGVVAPFDVLRAQTQLANNQQQLISTRNQVSIARNSFANTLGIDPGTSVTLTAPTTVPALPDLTEATLVEKAMAQRPEAQQAQLNVDKAKTNTRLAHRNIEPYASASLSGGYNPGEQSGSNDRATAAVSVSVSVPLSDGGATKNAVAAAKTDERGAEITRDQFARGIKAEVQQAIIAVRDASERLQTAEGSLTQAREAYRLANVRYTNGVDTQLSVNDAQTALTQAESNAVNARYDYLSALARLNRAIGVPEQ